MRPWDVAAAVRLATRPTQVHPEDLEEPWDWMSMKDPPPHGRKRYQSPWRCRCNFCCSDNTIYSRERRKPEWRKTKVKKEEVAA